MARRGGGGGLAVGGLTIAVGVVCVLVGTTWCWWAVEQARTDDVTACEEELLYGCKVFDEELQQTTTTTNCSELNEQPTDELRL